MPDAFFSSASVQRRDTGLLVPACGACRLFETCKSPYMKVSGKGKKKILILAEAPGEEEDKHGVQLVGNSGQEIQKLLRRVGVELREDCWLTNSLICRPPGNRKPYEKEINFCRPNLTNTLNKLKPEIIIPLGLSAVKSLLGGVVWKSKIGAATRWVGWRIPAQKWNAWVCPTYHPSFLLRQKDEVLAKIMERHLEGAAELVGSRPYKDIPPDYSKQVKVVFDSDEAEKEIRIMISFARKRVKIAFDYETSCLKPEGKEARILSCSLSNGTTTIAYPWHGKAIEETGKFLASPIPKIASNMKFEERWTREVFGHGVRNWDTDTMLKAHWLDNRTGITSIKFQAFVLLGYAQYDEHIAPYRKSKGGGGYTKNRLDEVDLRELLVYNGLDSLLEWKVAEIQNGT